MRGLRGNKNDPDPLMRADAVGLDSPIEDLALSRRARNSLRKAGYETVRSLVEGDGAHIVRQLGVVTREEVVNTLREHGLGTPNALVEVRNERISGISEELARLREQIDSTSRHLKARVERLEARLRKLDAAAHNGAGDPYED